MGELETEAQNTRGEVAPYRRQLADQLDEGGAVTLELGNQRVSSAPPIRSRSNSKANRTGPRAIPSIEFELVWRQEAQTAEEGSRNIEQTGP
jgi:hypothetical protein